MLPGVVPRENKSVKERPYKQGDRGKEAWNCRTSAEGTPGRNLLHSVRQTRWSRGGERKHPQTCGPAPLPAPAGLLLSVSLDSFQDVLLPWHPEPQWAFQQVQALGSCPPPNIQHMLISNGGRSQLGAPGTLQNHSEIPRAGPALCLGSQVPPCHALPMRFSISKAAGGRLKLSGRPGRKPQPRPLLPAAVPLSRL